MFRAPILLFKKKLFDKLFVANLSKKHKNQIPQKGLYLKVGGIQTSVRYFWGSATSILACIFRVGVVRQSR